jgi:threonine aldolase
MRRAMAEALVRAVPAPGGVPDLEALQRAIRRGPFQAPTGLIALENTHNLAGGRVVPLEARKAVQVLEAVDRALQSKAP